jgi:RHS repeat-associated protein
VRETSLSDPGPVRDPLAAARTRPDSHSHKYSHSHCTWTKPRGLVTSKTGTGPDQPFGFADGYQAAGGLLHYGQRYYDPRLGRWTQPDILENSSSLKEANHYLYVGDDPVNFVDPTGTSTVGASCTAAAGPAVTAGIVEKSHRPETARKYWGTGAGVGPGEGVGVGCSAMAWTGGDPRTKSYNVTACFGVCIGGGTSGFGFGVGPEAGVTVTDTEPISQRLAHAACGIAWKLCAN